MVSYFEWNFKISTKQQFIHYNTSPHPWMDFSNVVLYHNIILMSYGFFVTKSKENSIISLFFVRK